MTTTASPSRASKRLTTSTIEPRIKSRYLRVAVILLVVGETAAAASLLNHYL